MLKCEFVHSRASVFIIYTFCDLFIRHVYNKLLPLTTPLRLSSFWVLFVSHREGRNSFRWNSRLGQCYCEWVTNEGSHEFRLQSSWIQKSPSKEFGKHSTVALLHWLTNKLYQYLMSLLMKSSECDNLSLTRVPKEVWKTEQSRILCYRYKHWSTAS